MNIYGVRGYLTPDSLPVDDHCRTFAIPNDVAWLSVFMGALLPLIYPENWQQFGSLTPEESAEVMLNVIWDAYENDLGICPALDAPYWDTVANVDDEVPEFSSSALLLAVPEVWFGELKVIDGNLTWVENAFIWAVAGFIAYAGQPGAAIAFVPFAQRFVLAFKKHDLGGIVNVFIDGELVDVIDTYQSSASIGREKIFTDNSGEPHTLWVEMSEDVNPAVTGDPVIMVVKKELDPAEVYPTNQRYDADCDCVQTTYDDGDTWIDTPAQDPRHSPIFLYPPVVADDPRCQAAANQVRFLNDVIDQTLSAIATGLDVIGIGTTLLPLFVELGPFAILFDLVLALASGLASAGATAISATFTNDLYDQLTCIFYCDIEDDGSVTYEDAVQIQTDVNDNIGGLASVIIGLMIALTGEVGLSNEGTIGEAPGDCSECECAWLACLVGTDISAVFSIVGTNGTFTGSGVETVTAFAGGDPTRPRTQAYITATLDSCSVISLAFFFEAADGFDNACGGGFVTSGFWQNNFATPISFGTGTPTSPVSYSGALTLTDLQIALGVACCDGCGTPPNTGTITEVRIRGVGDIPSQLEPYLC